MQYEMIANNPYVFTQDDVLFEVFAERRAVPAAMTSRPAAGKRVYWALGTLERAVRSLLLWRFPLPCFLRGAVDGGIAEVGSVITRGDSGRIAALAEWEGSHVK